MNKINNHRENMAPASSDEYFNLYQNSKGMRRVHYDLNNMYQPHNSIHKYQNNQEELNNNGLFGNPNSFVPFNTYQPCSNSNLIPQPQQQQPVGVAPAQPTENNFNSNQLRIMPLLDWRQLCLGLIQSHRKVYLKS